jgi:hypothetical protein
MIRVNAITEVLYDRTGEGYLVTRLVSDKEYTREELGQAVRDAELINSFLASHEQMIDQQKNVHVCEYWKDEKRSSYCHSCGLPDTGY